jgi:hypothetical protein
MRQGMKLSAPTKDGLNEDLKNGFELAQNSLQLELPYSLSLTV